MADIIRVEYLNRAQELHNQGRIADAYRVLADAGDVYAANAWLITNDDHTGIFDFLVPNLWDYGAPGARATMFMQVAAVHQQNYLNYIRDGAFTAPGGLTFYELPDTFEIETSYYNALTKNGLPPELAIDLLINTGFGGYVDWAALLQIEPSRQSAERLTLDDLGATGALGVLFKAQVLGLLDSGGLTPEQAIEAMARMGPGSPLLHLVIEALREAENNCFTADTLIEMWPRSDGRRWHKPIEAIRPRDLVCSYDAQGRLVPGRVTRVFRKLAPHLLDFWGTGVTPGHLFLCGDGPMAGRHLPLIDILRRDGVVVTQGGRRLRAATGAEVGTLPDRRVRVVAGPLVGDRVQVTATGMLRLGTRFRDAAGADVSLLEGLVAALGPIPADGRLPDGRLLADLVLHWPGGQRLPAPEDYLLSCAGLTLADIAEQPEDQAPALWFGGALRPV